MNEQRLFNVQLRNAAGREAVVTVGAKTGNSATGIATRAHEKLTGERWYAVRCDPR